jgi:anti-sigma factor RsiW
MSTLSDRARELMHRHLDGSASRDEALELRRLLEAHPELAAELFARAGEQIELGALLKASPATSVPRIPSAPGAAPAEVPARPDAPAALDPGRPGGGGRRRRLHPGAAPGSRTGGPAA